MSSEHGNVSQKRKNEGIRAFIDRMRQKKQKGDEECEVLIDHYSVAEGTRDIVQNFTGLIFDDINVFHKCEWDENYPENPERYLAVLETIHKMNLKDRCTILICTTSNDSLLDMIHTKHTQEHIERLRTICSEKTTWEISASRYDAVYFNEDTYESAKISVDCAVSLIQHICTGEVQNGMALTRPPGHHAMNNEYCGYCYFNNVAIAAEYALKKNFAKKVLIVDWDVHHGQGTQQMFYEDDRVLYFSIHRFENGLFWPNLAESNFNHIGAGKGLGYNINVPLNDIGFGDAEYMAILMMVLMPVAYEFAPDLIIVSAGYDAAIGCPEGQMKVSPGCYGHYIRQLSSLAGGKIAVCLEGGYFIDSLSLSAAMTLKSLLGDALSDLGPMGIPHPRCITVINNIRYMLKDIFKCFQIMPVHVDNYSPWLELKQTNRHIVKILYLGEPLKPPHLTRNCYPVQNADDVARFTNIVKQFKSEYCSMNRTQSVCYTYTAEMLKHNHPSNVQVHEQPLRISRLYDKFVEFNLNTRCNMIKCKSATLDQILSIHSLEYYKYLEGCPPGQPEKFDSVYLNQHTLSCAALSAGSLISVIDEVMKGRDLAGIAMIRPPGHHADREAAGGYCFFNNVAIAAKYVMTTYHTARVLIVDWDIHHGNGTQNAFYNDDRVLYISVHRYDDGKFYPKSNIADYTYTGGENAKGKNVNIPFSNGTMGDAEYLRVFQDIILPIAYSFAPEIVIVSAGFDAGINDPLGGYTVSPQSFGHFTNMLRPLANGRLILALEGGYNVETVAYSMTLCAKALLGDPLPAYNTNNDISPNALETIRNVIKTQSEYWPILKTYRELPDEVNFTFDINESRTGPIGTTVINPSLPNVPNDYFKHFMSTVVNGSSLPGNKIPADALEKFVYPPIEHVEESEDINNKKCVHVQQLFPANEEPILNPLSWEKYLRSLENSICRVCKTESKNLTCLICFGNFCSRFEKQHMIDHFEDVGHPLAIHIEDSMIWCYECEHEVDGPNLYDYKNLLRVVKHGDLLEWTYGTLATAKQTPTDDK